MALYVQLLDAFWFADSHVIAAVLFGLLMFMYLLFALFALLLNHTGVIRLGILFIM